MTVTPSIELLLFLVMMASSVPVLAWLSNHESTVTKGVQVGAGICVNGKGSCLQHVIQMSVACDSDVCSL